MKSTNGRYRIRTPCVRMNKSKGKRGVMHEPKSYASYWKLVEEGVLIQVLIQTSSFGR